MDSPLNAAPRTVVELVPETEGSFDDVVDVAGARSGIVGGRRIGDRPARKSLRCAARVVEEGAAVADGNWSAGTREGIRRTRGVFAAEVSIKVQLGIGMSFESSQPSVGMNGSQGAIGPGGYVGQLG